MPFASPGHGEPFGGPRRLVPSIERLFLPQFQVVAALF
jgi:hypothetical protein